MGRCSDQHISRRERKQSREQLQGGSWEGDLDLRSFGRATMGANRIFAFCRDLGYLDADNCPTSSMYPKYIDYREQEYAGKRVYTPITTKEGRIFLYNRMVEEGIL